MADEWTVTTLKEYFEKILVEKDKAINLALAAAKEAVAVAEANAEKWRDNANEWRAAMNDRESKFLQKNEFDTYKEATEKALVLTKENRDVSQGKGLGVSQGWGWAVAVIMFALAMFAFFSKFAQ